MVERGGEDHLGHADFLIQQLFDDAKAVEPGHLDIEENEIRVMFLDEIHGLNAVSPLRNHIDLAHRLQQESQFVARELLVIHNHCR